MKKTWVVVAESSRARIFLALTPGYELDELAALTHPEARLKERDIRSDSPGRTFDSAGTGRHAMVEATDLKRHEQMVFAKQIAAHLDAARLKDSYERLIVCAPPEFLGLLRKALSPATAERVDAEVNKNLVRLSPAEIADNMPGKL